jgi:hypothetical protein
VWCEITPFEFRLVAVIHPETDKIEFRLDVRYCFLDYLGFIEIELGCLLVIVTNFKHLLDSLYCGRCLRNKGSIDLVANDAICYGRITVFIQYSIKKTCCSSSTVTQAIH